ncbi:MAG: glycosyl hydrolase 115 family protein [Bacteroides sp.]|nr:glycosyl hydrolase 115 family protein [Bacteroides sp.]
MRQYSHGKDLCLLALISLMIFQGSNLAGQVILEKDSYRIVCSADEEGPLKLALKALEEDLTNIFSSAPPVVDKLNRDRSALEIVIVNMSSGHMKVPASQLRELDGFESHRIYTDTENNRIYLLGNDLRGTIFAIYTFAEEILGVPPLKYWSSWQPEKKDIINLAPDLDISYHTPQVRYRTLLPGDQDFFTPWKKHSAENNNIWLETALRLKINTVETYSTILPDYMLTDYAYLIDKYGLVITSHHTSGLNTSFRTWGDYWREMRTTEPPDYLLSNEQNILDFFSYNAETVERSGIENLWTVAFRGERDQPFWSIFKDAPEDEKERAEVINRMHQIQYDLIKEKTGEDQPYARITLYDELAILMAKGYLKPPLSENMILTFVAGRRDHYPFDDIVNYKASDGAKLGYYMNFGFASTGAHVAPAEGPWKMEFNYRYVNNKAPLYFSVVNVGNFREFVLELSANAKMLWDYNSYSSDQFMTDYCAQYFGEKYAGDIATLYKEFYNAYWIPKESEFEGLERQFVFQDLRYARVFDHVFEKFIELQSVPDLNPLHKIGYESIPGRTFRIDPEFNNADNQVDAMLNGMKLTIPKFESVALKCSAMMLGLEDDKKTFFNDNLRLYAYYMTHLSKTLYHYIYAYKHQNDKQLLMKNLDLAYIEISRAQQYLLEGEHGVFSSWYSDADPLTRTFQIDVLKGYIISLKEQASQE